MKKTERTVEEYLGSFEGPAHTDLVSLYRQISAHMPGITPKLWEGTFWGGSQQSIIGFGDLQYTRSDKKIVDWFVIGLSLQKNYISVYSAATEDGQYIVKKYGHLLGKAKLGSSSISFKRLADIDMDELLKLVDKAHARIG